ncbi:pentapeptide repeat-containing protein [Sphaerospermopsis torques-reginae]|uniref:Pentapeptide repeat-containing protein n=1 Tax=Sphaerospermopsis torques-reginae ITEP-024 TaxID=984208 RepID=A0ABX8X195_9CYAN|nr:pentapeptide repeat-containing protein [Sphaerospermopsis torques-reginae]QYX32442.1 pentapeptide repeat-containing protein [Sphaerospermopsis torques-reginae ITEP-024]
MTDSQNNDSLPENLKRVYDSFAKLEQMKDPIRQEYELLEAAKSCNLPVDSFRQMFKDYCRQQHETRGMQRFFSATFWRTELLLEKLNHCLSELDIFPVLEHLSKLSILVALILYVTECGEREEQKNAQQRRANYEAWGVIRASENKPGNLGRIEALQDLNKQNPQVYLTHINLKKATLSEIDLPKAMLDGADFSQATLDQANLQGAILFNTNLYQANLINANLKNSRMFGANLEGTILEGADLEGADLTGVKGLKVTQIQKAKNYKLANYDPPLRKELGLSDVK